MKLLFLDFEATDIDLTKARPTQIAYSIYDSETHRELYHHSSLLYDDNIKEINETAQAITGITLEQLKLYGENIQKEMVHLIGVLNTVDYLICHNGTNFDIPLMKQEFAKIELPYTLPKTIDTRVDIPYPAHIETRKLVHLCAEHGFVSASAHSARHDVDLMAKLFFMYPLNEIIRLSESPTIWIRADVDYDRKELAKEKKFMWDGKNKYWMKQVKECLLPEFEKDCKFKIIILKDYTP